jgi:hypothetical protein
LSLYEVSFAQAEQENQIAVLRLLLLQRLSSPCG